MFLTLNTKKDGNSIEYDWIGLAMVKCVICCYSALGFSWLMSTSDVLHLVSHILLHDSRLLKSRKTMRCLLFLHLKICIFNFCTAAIADLHQQMLFSWICTKNINWKEAQQVWLWHFLIKTRTFCPSWSQVYFSKSMYIY